MTEAEALERARAVCPFKSYHTPDCGWCVDIAREIQRAAEEATAAERERAAKYVARSGCTMKCGEVGRWPPLPEGQAHWGNCAASVADQIRSGS